ncbi:TIGR04219 family outer membrane beta-barrel protein [Desulfobotulus sp. H1]|uniref:TIGR04219 family outer membrane beta-barrel protein n=1 Tax=Desulfobotulus pelophilus TaxID=2823377 RepID=A0ABT3N6R9_9BACT|nr:TIGR04219 family outer membrane beta-barrel protein [Desulfobotulus pelophilus]MCW7753158.1 TIGR04219 family outer membrane beta-barrel protein [Desulfobotulus pelophilus]
MRQSLMLALLAFALALPVSTFALPLINAEIAAGGWMQRPSGDMGVTLSGLAGTRLDLERDLGYDNEYRPAGRFKIDMPLLIPNISVMATPMKFEGEGSFQQTFHFAGKTFDAGLPYSSELKMDQLDVALYYGVPFLGLASLGTLGVDFGINVRLYQLEASMTQGATHGKKSVNVPIPMAYLAARFEPMDALGLEAELRGLAIGDNQIVSALGRVRYNVLGIPMLTSLFVAGGWRHELIDIDESGVRIDTTFSGPFLELGLKF